MHVPPGFGRVTPYLFVDDAERFLDFLMAGLGGHETLRHLRPDGKIANAQVRFDDSTVMVSEATEDYPAMPSSFYLFVDDADRAMSRAIEHGATMVLAVAEMPYGDRQGGVRDPHGNLWWISQRLSADPYD